MVFTITQVLHDTSYLFFSVQLFHMLLFVTFYVTDNNWTHNPAQGGGGRKGSFSLVPKIWGRQKDQFLLITIIRG